MAIERDSIPKSERFSKITLFIFYLQKCAIRLVLELISTVLSQLYQPKRSRIPSIKDKILVTSAVELSKKIRDGELKSEQVVESYIKQIRRVNPIINAVVAERYDTALQEARSIDNRLEEARKGVGDSSILDRPLIGIPFTVKETVALKGSPFTAGLPSRRLVRATQSNGAVENLVNAGLIPIGVTNTPCMNMWWDTDNVVYGRTDNPYDLSRIVGGSSGGEAAILAAAGSVVGVGSDLAGSIRLPCNFCGVFGHKPTPYTVSTSDLFPAMRKSQEKLRGIGPMTRYACDLTPMLKIMVEQKELNKLKLDEPVNLKQLKIYYCEDLESPLVSRCDPDILTGLQNAVSYFSSEHNLTVERVSLDEFKYGLILWSAELSVAEGNIKASEHKDGTVHLNPATELVKHLILGTSDYPLGTIITSAVEKIKPDYGSGKHKYLVKKAAKLRERFYNLVGDDGVLLLPAHPQVAPHHKTTALKFLNVAYTALGNTLQAPITQCPLGMSKEGLPFGVQIISKPYNDRLCLAVAQELEKVFGGWLPPARVTI